MKSRMMCAVCMDMFHPAMHMRVILFVEYVALLAPRAVALCSHREGDPRRGPAPVHNVEKRRGGIT